MNLEMQSGSGQREGIPRVSGDEPNSVCNGSRDDRYSPRERG